MKFSFKPVAHPISVLFALIVSAPLFCYFSSCSNSPKNEFREMDGIVWATTFHIVYQADRDFSDSIMATMKEIEESLSVFKEGSLTDLVNKSQQHDIDSHFLNVYNESKRVNAYSGGLFDPTISPLINAWGFGKGHIATADTMRLDSLLRICGIARTHLEGMKLYKDNPLIQFNFSAVAKGYGADCVGKMLKRNGVENYLVEIGGEIKTSGRNRQGEYWHISIDYPSEDGNPSHNSIWMLNLSGHGLATSGNYRNVQTGKSGRYGHTISPLDGRPLQSDVISASVAAPTCMEADAAATACMAVGSARALEICDSLDYGVLLVLSDFTVLHNAPLEWMTAQDSKRYER